MRLSNKIFLRICTFLLTFGLLASALASLPASAATYGCNAYGTSSYQQNCPPSATTPTTTPAKSSARSVPASSGETPSVTEILLNSYSNFFTGDGITITALKVGDVIHFCAVADINVACDANNAAYHSITVKSIDLATSTLVLTFASTPTDYTLVKDTSKNINVNEDSQNDIGVTVIALTATTADINFKNLLKPSPTTTANTTPAAAAGTSKKSSKWVLIVSILAILLAIAWFIMLVTKRRRPKNITF